MKLALFWMGVLSLLLAPTALAADGDACDSGIGKITRGRHQTVVCVNLCDTKVAANSSCADFDMNTVGMPDQIVFEYEENGVATCSGTPDFAITTGPITGGTPSYELDATAVVLNPTTNRVIVDARTAVLDRWLFTAITDDAACLDVDIRMYLINEGETQ